MKQRSSKTSGCGEGRRDSKPGLQEKGAQLVEFAFILPFVLVFVIGITEFGRGYNIYHNVTNGAREGARLSTIPENNQPSNAPDNIRNRVVNYMNSLGLQTSYYTGAATKNPSGTTVTTYVYGSYPNGAYLLINQAEKIQKLDSSGNPISLAYYIGSKVTLTYPHTFPLFHGVINLMLSTTTYNGTMYIKNTAVIEND